MPKFNFSKRSLDNLKGVHPDLVKVAHAAIADTPFDFTITCGLRTIEEQRVLVATGKSQTMNSRHLTGHAIDIVAYDENGKITWDLKYYTAIAKDGFEMVAKDVGVPIEWGGYWKSLVDGPHFQLPRASYPNIWSIDDKKKDIIVEEAAAIFEEKEALDRAIDARLRHHGLI